MLTGKAKTDYQREYMRRRRSNKGLTQKPESVRPTEPVVVRPTTRPGPTVAAVSKPTVARRYTGELTKTRQVSQHGFRKDTA